MQVKQYLLKLNNFSDASTQIQDGYFKPLVYKEKTQAPTGAGIFFGLLYH